MSTLSHAPKLKTPHTLKPHNLSLLIVALIAVALFAIFIANTGLPETKIVNRQAAYMLYRQGEWVYVPIPASDAGAYQMFRASEVTSPLISSEVYHLYRVGEWVSVSIPAIAVDMTVYRLSERTLVDPNAGFVVYQASEHTYVDPSTSMTIYLNSERTSVRQEFNPYQLSEWFGK